MGIGGFNEEQHLSKDTKINYIPYQPNRNQYYIEVRGLKMGGIETGLDMGDFSLGDGTFIDSGTTLFYTHSKIHR